MTSSKSTKRALIFSALAILMCVSMLFGTTFAWFTDTASTAVNKIQAGTLDVDIVDENGEDYLYHPKCPQAIAGEYKGGRIEIVEDDDNSTLYKAIYG